MEMFIFVKAFMKNSTFSIIIPHYGIPNLLRRCLASIPVRDDMQVIVVDDDSPDFPTYSERFPELFRPEVTWVHAPRNGGSGYARNLGLEKAEGKWLLFADADDFFTDGLPAFLDENEEATEDIIYFRNRCVLSDKPEQESRRDCWMGAMFDRYSSSGDPDEIRFNHCTPWGKMLRRSFLESHQIRFDETPYAADVYFSVLAGSKANSVRIDNRVLYVLTEREGSLTNHFCQKPDELRIRADATLRAQKVMKDCGYKHPLFPFGRFLHKMLHQDRDLFLQYFPRIPEVYDSYRQPLREMARKEKGVLRKGLLYGYSLYAYCRGVVGKRLRTSSSGE